MDTSSELAPAVRSILEAAAGRGTPDRRVSVDARSLPDALAAAEADGRAPVIAEVKPTSPTTDTRRSGIPRPAAVSSIDRTAGASSELVSITVH